MGARAVFADRAAAAALLADELAPFSSPDAIVLGVARGGVPIAAIVAIHLGLPVDAIVVERVRIDGLADLDAGAVISGGVRVVHHEHLRALGLSDAVVEDATSVASARLAAAEPRLRGDAPLSDLRRRRVIVVDDGMASGITMRSAVRGVRALGASTIVVGVGVAAPEALDSLWGTGAHRVVCCASPFAFSGVDSCFEQYDALTDDAVRHTLDAARAHRERPSRSRVAGPVRVDVGQQR